MYQDPPNLLQSGGRGGYIIREANDNGYYYLIKEDGTTLADPINGKWLKLCYA